MDFYDLKIVNQLMNNARTTWVELSSLLGISAPAVAERVRKLEECGVIKNYHACIEPEKINCGLAALVSITLNQPEYRAQFVQLINKLPQVQECHHVAGEEDYIIKIRCKNTRELENIISNNIKSITGVRTKTTIILSSVKETIILPLDIDSHKA